ncbi:MAG: sigma-70 family RNA polymerase sigma factor [Phycisphaerales bacterium]|nr:sigma-70 family RNA polymerase sigma factor [Phycisphaerales bacterium]MCB9862658.1 sigma-70 family RNA polymerase sigma factor [Phycisphaerales bacterium]
MNDATRQDGEYWARFFETEHRRLCTVAIAWLGNTDEALDLVQDVLVRFVERGISADAPLAFCVRAIRNAAIDQLRRRRRLPKSEPLGPACESIVDIGAAKNEAQRHAAEYVQLALSQLKPAEREVIVLKVYAQLTFAEIADILAAPQGTIATHYRRGLEAMRKFHRERIDDAA